MALNYPKLTDFDQATVDQFRTLLASIVQEYNPSLTLKRGLIHDWVFHLRALLDTAQETYVDWVRKSCSLLEITKDPALADPDAVDRVLSNYRLVRHPGSKASGSVTIVLSSLTPVVIPQGTIFTANGVNFVTDQVYAARTSQLAVTGPGDRLLVQVGTNRYTFTIDVTAVADGVAGNARRGDIFSPSSTPPKFVNAYAEADFTGGADEETNVDLLNRLQAGLAVQAWSNRASVEALLRAQPDFVNLGAISLIGFGDPEMTRDTHGLWPGSTGGRADLYFRMGAVNTIVLRKTATLIAKSGTVGTWQFGLGRDDAPGYYEVSRILTAGADPTSAVGMAVTSEVRAIDVTGLDFVPDMTTVVEGTYSRYQASTVQFTDTSFDASALTVNVSQRDYDVEIRLTPQTDQIQDFLNTREHRPPMGDVLVKAAVPCFLSVSFTVNVWQGQIIPDTNVLKQQVAAAVNGLSFTGKVTGSLVSKVVYDQVPGLAGVTQMDLLGRIRRPDGQMVYIRSPDDLVVPNDPINGVTTRTVAFFCSPSDVTVATVVVDTPAI